MLASTEKHINTQKGRVMGCDTIQVPKTEHGWKGKAIVWTSTTTKKDVNVAEGVHQMYRV
jgi:hypothetical protein